jgi:hypothetical protein
VCDAGDGVPQPYVARGYEKECRFGVYGGGYQLLRC